MKKVQQTKIRQYISCKLGYLWSRLTVFVSYFYQQRNYSPLLVFEHPNIDQDWGDDIDFSKLFNLFPINSFSMLSRYFSSNSNNSFTVILSHYFGLERRTCLKTLKRIILELIGPLL